MGARGAAAALVQAGIAAIRDRGNQDRMGMGGGNCEHGLAGSGDTHRDPSPTPNPGHTYLQQNAENVPADDEQFSRGCRHCRHGSESGWLRASAAKGCGFAEGRWSLGVRCWAHCRCRRGRALSIRPPPKCACAFGGGSKRGGSQGRSSFVRRGKNNPSALSTPTPAS